MKEKQIEELAFELAENCLSGNIPRAYDVAEHLVEQGYRKVAEDVIPRSEVEKFIQEIDQIQKDKAEVNYLKEQLITKAKQEVAREIFEELEEMSEVCEYSEVVSWKSIAELKKKYIGE